MNSIDVEHFLRAIAEDTSENQELIKEFLNSLSSDSETDEP